MDTATLFLVLAIAGVNFGWQPVENGSEGYEYIVQVEPELLDALKRGEAIPIESNIPTEIAPIRKVRIVVGRDQLPRGSVRHTAHFADPWTPDRYSAAPSGNTNFDRYQAPTGTAAAGVGPPPTILDRAGTAVDETANALGSGIQAGAESVSNQLSRAGNELMNGASDTTQDVNQQLKQWTSDASGQVQELGNNLRAASTQAFGAANSQPRQTENPFGQTGGAAATGSSGVTAPPWPLPTSTSSPPSWSPDATASQTLPIDYAAAPASPITRTATGWTSIGSNVAAPPLLNPPLKSPPTSNPGTRLAANNPNGPLFPAETTVSREPIHRPLVDPAAESAGADPAAKDWARDWGSSITTVQPTIRDPGTQTDPWLTQPSGNLPANPPSQKTGPIAIHAQTADASSAQPGIGSAAVPTNTVGVAANSNFPPAGTMNEQQGFNNRANQGPPVDQPPWLPLLIVSLSLVGSLSANLFLGWSYMDARQKYRALVRKTADTFRRVASAAAA